jgi:hypothetical protein
MRPRALHLSLFGGAQASAKPPRHRAAGEGHMAFWIDKPDFMQLILTKTTHCIQSDYAE